MTPEYLIKRFQLEPLEIEGGMFHRYYHAEETIPIEALPPRYRNAKRFGNAICYLYQPHTESFMHRLHTDEIYHFYRGDPVTMLLLYPHGKHEIRTLGAEYEAGHEPFIVVPRGVWQGSFLNPGGAWAFIGCTLAPAYEDTDFELADRKLLLAEYPAVEHLLRRLTPDEPSALLTKHPTKASEIRVQQK